MSQLKDTFSLQSPELAPVLAPDLVQFLFDQYREAATKHEPEHGAQLVDGAKQFLEFAQAYLEDNRPRTTFSVDSNVGIVLSNGARLIVAPGFNNEDSIPGTMAPIAGVRVPTRADGTQPDAYMAQGAIPISGFATEKKNTINYADKNYGKTVVDKTAKTDTVKFNTRRPVAHDPLNPS